jgi:hypothetical protein
MTRDRLQCIPSGVFCCVPSGVFFTLLQSSRQQPGKVEGGSNQEDEEAAAAAEQQTAPRPEEVINAFAAAKVIAHLWELLFAGLLLAGLLFAGLLFAGLLFAGSSGPVSTSSSGRLDTQMRTAVGWRYSWISKVGC